MRTFQSSRPRGARPAEVERERDAAEVSILAPAGGATPIPAFRAAGATTFQSSRPRGARPSASVPPSPPRRGLILAAPGGAARGPARRRASRHAGDDGFQSSRPRGARPGGRPRGSRARGFNPRARGGRDAQETHPAAPHEVSILAPAGGATCARSPRPRRRSRFNPRARGGRDPQPPQGHPFPHRFNPRARGGRDIVGSAHDGRTGRVSILAPAGGATRSTICKVKRPGGFNPRARGGRDRTACSLPKWRRRFQSSRPRGARPGPPIELVTALLVSILAPAGGATRC